MTLSSLSRKVLLLANEPGGLELERQRHQEFKGSRVQGEWFRKTPALLGHVASVRGKHGILETGDGHLPGWGIAPLRS